MKLPEFAVGALVLFAALAALPFPAAAQGPSVSFFYHPATDLPWARASLHHGGGATQKVPFLPVVNSQHFLAPLGTGNLARDVSVDAPLVFVGNGLSVEGDWDSYVGRRLDGSVGEIDVAGKIVFFTYDSRDDHHTRLGASFPLEHRIAEAARRDAAGVVVFSSTREHPFLEVQYSTPADIPDIPAISVSRQAALDIFAASGAFSPAILQDWASNRTPPESMELINSMRIEFTGAFPRIETDNFTFSYPPGAYRDEDLREIARLNEESLVFLMDNLRQDVPLRWERLFSVSFPGFDSKIFYTRHWGGGLASAMGTFAVSEGVVPDWGLIVHENMHILGGVNWGTSTSFLTEGIAKYMEALATEKDSNDEQTVRHLLRDQLFPLEEMITFDIGEDGLKTQVGYPAAGSLTGFLVDTYGLQRFREAYALEGRTPQEREADDTWSRAFGKGLHDLETEWIGGLSEKHRLGQEPLRRHLNRVADFRRTIPVEPAILERYVGSYMLTAGFPLDISRDGDRLRVRWPDAGRFTLVARSQTEFRFSLTDALITFIVDDNGEVGSLALRIQGRTIRGEREVDSGPQSIQMCMERHLAACGPSSRVRPEAPAPQVHAGVSSIHAGRASLRTRASPSYRGGLQHSSFAWT
jgi:hypothetical protein